MRKIIAPAIVMIIVIAAYGVFSKTGSNEAKTDVPPSTIKNYVAAEGKIVAMPGAEIEVGSEMDGKVADIFVEEGDVVAQGRILARLENSDIQAQLKEAEAELSVEKAKYKEVASGAREEEIKKAKAALERAVAEMETAQMEFGRYEQLFKETLVSKSMLDEKEKALKVSAAKVKEADEEKRLLEKGPKPETLKLHEDSVRRAEAAAEYCRRILDKTIIKSPIAGKVLRKYLQKGEMISKEMQTSIVAVADVEKIRINAEVDETDIGKIHIGDTVDVTSDAYTGKVFKGEVREISDYAGVRKVKPNDPAKNLDMKVVQVKIDFSEKTPFRLGMTVDVKITPRE